MLKTTILILSLAFGCFAGDIIINEQADHSHVRTVVVVNVNPDRGHSEWFPRQRAKWEEALLLNGFNVVERSKIETVIEEHKLNQSGFAKENQYLKAGELISADAILYFNEKTRVPVVKGYEYSSQELPNNIKLISIKTGNVLFLVNTEILPQTKELWRKALIRKYRAYLDTIK